MAACERCWREYSTRVIVDPDLTYSRVVVERERAGNVCTVEEQCGDLHLVLEFPDGRHCRCGKVRELTP